MDPSAQARVTSTKSCLQWRSRNVEATLTEKSFHFRLYFCVLPILVLPSFVARSYKKVNYYVKSGTFFLTCKNKK